MHTSPARKAVDAFYPQVKEKLENRSLTYMEVAELFKELHPEFDHSALTIKKYFFERHNGKGEIATPPDPSEFKRVELDPIPKLDIEPKADLSGFNFADPTMDIPETWSEPRPKYPITGIKKLGYMSDIHLPYHNYYAILAAVNHHRENKIDGLLLNGDVMDMKSLCHHASRERIKSATLQEEINVGIRFLTELRKAFPDIPIIYKEGNHETWLTLAVNKVPQLASVAGIDIPSLLKLKDLDIIHVPEWQVMTFGDLHIIHGHEIRASGKHVAANMLNKAFDNVLCGHFHRQQSSAIHTLGEKTYGAWTTGCLSDLKPHYAGANPQAEHGFATISLLEDDMFHVELRRIINGRVI